MTSDVGSVQATGEGKIEEIEIKMKNIQEEE